MWSFTCDYPQCNINCRDQKGGVVAGAAGDGWPLEAAAGAGHHHHSCFLQLQGLHHGPQCTGHVRRYACYPPVWLDNLGQTCTMSRWLDKLPHGGINIILYECCSWILVELILGLMEGHPWSRVSMKAALGWCVVMYTVHCTATRLTYTPPTCQLNSEAEPGFERPNHLETKTIQRPRWKSW